MPWGFRMLSRESFCSVTYLSDLPQKTVLEIGGWWKSFRASQKTSLHEAFGKSELIPYFELSTVHRFSRLIANMITCLRSNDKSNFKVKQVEHRERFTLFTEYDAKWFLRFIRPELSKINLKTVWASHRISCTALYSSVISEKWKKCAMTTVVVALNTGHAVGTIVADSKDRTLPLIPCRPALCEAQRKSSRAERSAPQF